MGFGRFRGLVAIILVIPFVMWTAATPAVAGVPGGVAAGGCSLVKYKRVGGTFAVRTLCSAPGSAFHTGGDGGSDPGCTFPRIKIFPDGTPHQDPTLPDGHFITEPSPTPGTWMYVEKSDWNDFPINANPPAGMSFDAWMHTFPTYQEEAGGNRVFEVVCLGPTAEYWGFYPDLAVPPTDPFWGNLPGQLADLVAQVPLATPTLAFTPGGPDVWGGFLTNAPYGVSLGNDGIWHSVERRKLDALEAWRLTVVASPVSARVIVKRGSSTKEMDCALGAGGPVTLTGLPRYDPPTNPANLPPCAFTARWAQGANISVSMRITYRIVGFIDNLAQAFPDQTTTSAVQTWPVVRAEAVNARAN